jgi:hypothetical protein
MTGFDLPPESLIPLAARGAWTVALWVQLDPLSSLTTLFSLFDANGSGLQLQLHRVSASHPASKTVLVDLFIARASLSSYRPITRGPINNEGSHYQYGSDASPPHTLGTSNFHGAWSRLLHAVCIGFPSSDTGTKTPRGKIKIK